MPQATVGRRGQRVRAARGRGPGGTRDVALAEPGAIRECSRSEAGQANREAASVGTGGPVGVAVIQAEEGQEPAVEEGNVRDLTVLRAELGMLGEGGLAARAPTTPKEDAARRVPELDIVRLARAPLVPLCLGVRVEDPARDRGGARGPGGGGGPARTPQSAGEPPGRRAMTPNAQAPGAAKPSEAAAQRSALDVAFEVEAPGTKPGNIGVEGGFVRDHGPHGNMKDHGVAIPTRGVATHAEDAILGGGASRGCRNRG